MEIFEQEPNIEKNEKDGITFTDVISRIFAGVIFGAGCLLQLLVSLLVPLIIGLIGALYLCDISPDESYCWYHGIWHGLFIIPNWTLSWFDSDVLCKAPDATWGYYVWWWIMLIGGILSVLTGGRRDRY